MRRLLFILLMLQPALLFAQGYKPIYDNLHPVSPTAFQFLKYTEMPVSEYTGIPQISVPVYTINVDGVSVPLNLTYHAGGIRVSQEASWVGLGWDLTVGSIVQQINDIDDYGTRPDGSVFTKMLPDYAFSGNPTAYPYQLACNLSFSPYATGMPPGPVQPFHGYKVATQYHVPVNGIYDVNRDLLFTADDWDSEPDIFQANFLGHSINFILDFKTNRLVVLNKRGYQIERINSNWKITVPSGEEFFFEEKSAIETNSATENYNTLSGSSSSGLQPSSNVWMLTKIVTIHKKEIVLNYSHGAPTFSFPLFSERFHKGSEMANSPFVQSNFSQGAGSFVSAVGDLTGYTKTISTSREAYVYLSSINFPNGQVTFTLGNRNDLAQSKKLEAIEISNLNTVIKRVDLNYDYFDATNIIGNGYDHYLPDQLASLRLKLSTVTDNNGSKYQFVYNSEPLPKKNSYAQDYWGFYNGKLDNTTLIPNPVQFNRVGLGNNGDNHSARLQYAKAGTLETVIYPTGGKAVFNYSMHEFNNYWVPDFNSSSNTISSGFGLRVSDVSFYDAENKLSLKQVYSYDGGKAVLPRDFFRHYQFTRFVDLHSGFFDVQTHNISMDEVSAQGFYSSNPFASLNSVGYDKVTKKQISISGDDLGKVVTEFYNNPDFITHTASVFSEINATLPAFKKLGVPNNGFEIDQQIFNKQGQLIKKVENEYINVESPLYYGARIFAYRQLNWVPCNPPLAISGFAQHLIGYYPVFDYESLLKKSKVTEYANGSMLESTTTNSYDDLNRLISTSTTKNAASERTEIAYPIWTSDPNSVSNKMFSANRLLDVFGKRTYKDFNNFTSKALDAYRSIFIQQGNLFLEQKAQLINPYPYDQLKSEVNYDQYDAEGNLLQYTAKGVTNSYIYDYNNQYPVAEITNAGSNDIAYTSFEANGKGNWTFAGNPINDITSPSGSKVYDLNTGNLVKNGLNAATTYILSYWKKGGVANVNGSQNVKTGSTINGWTYYEHEFKNVTTGILYGYGLIDEVRIYPKTAQMTSYTYAPLIGVTSQCDVNNRITYYEYDNSRRLRRIKDMYGNILKVFDYQYQINP